MSDAFLDTNILISFVFYINSLHPRAKKVFELYSEFFCSFYVKEEFERRFNSKLRNISDFFFDFQKYLENPQKEFYSISDLFNFVSKEYEGKKLKDVSSSIDPFWNNYIGIESQISFLDMKNMIDTCLNDLTIDSNINKGFLENIIKLTPQRRYDYPNIDAQLRLHGVSDEDRIVTLDGHDFACASVDPIDFVTFDYDCFNGAKNTKMLCFNSIKGKYDFNS
ncbi:MAG: hypothetical protein Q4Q18_05765 [Methanobrevibacter sp.]|nr:hypothetical protein [Methanobrevibacter sp.]